MTASTRSQGPIGRYLPVVIRVLLGLAFVVFGLNLFFMFLPQPPPDSLPPRALAFVGALAESGYMMYLIGATQLLVGALLLLNRFVPLALTILAPFMVNSLAFHIALEPSGTPMALAITAMMLYLAWVHRAAYRPLLTARS